MNRYLADTIAGTRELLGFAAYRRLLLAQGISEIGNWLTNVALILLLYRLLDLPAAAAIVLLTKLLPRALIYPFGGLLADKFDRRSVMILADLTRAGLVASILLVRSPEGVWWVLAATGLAQMLASLFNPAARALVPTVAPAARLAAANALLSAVKEFAFVAGPLLGALVVVAGGVEVAFLLDAGTFLASAALLAGLHVPARPAVARKAFTMRRDLAAGWAVVRSQRSLMVLCVAQVLFGGLITTLNALLIPLLVTYWAQPEELLGLLYGAVAAGSLVGAVLAAQLAPAGYLRATLAALALIGATTAALGLVPWLGPALGLLVIIGFASMVGDVAATSAIQAGVDNDRLGRVFGLLFWFLTLGQAAGAGLGWAASAASPVLLIIVLGLATVAAAPLLAVALRPADAPATELTELTWPS